MPTGFAQMPSAGRYRIANATIPAVLVETAEALPSVGEGLVGADIEILGFASEEHVTHGTTYKMRLVTGLVQAVKHLDGILRNVCARDIVFGTRDDQGLDDCVLLALHQGR